METLKNYVNWKLAHSDKTATAEGYPLVMENCKANKRMKQLEVYGDYFQETCGKNLFNINNITAYSGNSTYSVDNGILTVSQTSTSKWQSKNIALDENLVGQTITVSAKVKTTGANNACIRLLWFNGSTQVRSTQIITSYYTGTDETTISATGIPTTKPEKYPNAKLCIAFYSNADARLSSTGNYSAEYREIQLEVSNAATEYEPYIPKPTPANPSEIETVGDLTTLNMFDMTKARSISSIELHEDENYFDIINNYTCGFMSITEFMSLGFEAGDTITTVKTAEVISGEATGSTGNIVLLSKNSTYPNIGLSSKIGYQIMTTTLPLDFDPSNYHGLYMYAVPGTGTVRYKNVMMLKGAYTEETIPKYEPYHKYKIPVIVRGKNLLDVSFLSNISGIIYQDGWYQGSAYSFLDYTTKNKNISGFFKPDTQYTFSWTVNTKATGLCFVVYYTDGTYSRLANASSTNTDLYLTGASQVGKSIDYVTIDYDANGTCKIKNIQIEKGLSATEYESYIEPVTQNIYLDEPLRGALYQRMENQWYYDVIDYKSHKVIRNIAEKTFTGATNEKWTNSKETDNKMHFYIANILNNCSFGGAPIDASVICNLFNESYEDATQNSDKEGISLALTTNMCYIAIFKTRLTDAGLTLDLDGFKTWLSQNPITVTYISKTPIEEDISCQLPKTHAKTTVISAGTSLEPSNIKGKYIIK